MKKEIYLSFRDAENRKCIIEPSVIVNNCIYLGVGYGGMHLNKEHVMMILPYLEKFIKE